MCTYVHALFCVLFYWYLLCSGIKQIYVLFMDNNEYSVFCIFKKRKEKEKKEKKAEVTPSFFLSLLLLSFSSRFYIYKFAVVGGVI